MARPGRPERNRAAQSFRQLKRFHHGINSNKVFGTHSSHNAMLSAIAAAEQVAAALAAGRSGDELAAYEENWRRSAIGKDLRRGRNVKPLLSKFGTLLGVAIGGFDMWTNTLGVSIFGTLRHGKPDNRALRGASKFKPIEYPKPDGRLTFDRLSSV